MMDIVIAGSGKIAANIGMFLLQQGNAVTWFSGSARQGGTFSERLRRRCVAMQRRGLIKSDTPSMMVYGYEDTCTVNPDIIIEATREDLAKKQVAAKRMRELFGDVPMVSTSSSILPEEIGYGVHGMHCFYPVELITCVEFIPGANKESAWLSSQIIEKLGFDPIWEDSQTAFAANRILLPLQAEAVRLLMEGMGHEQIDMLSENELIPCGQHSLMQSIGPMLLHQCVRQYCLRMSSRERISYQELNRVLQGAAKSHENEGELLMGGVQSGSYPDGDEQKNIQDLFCALTILSCRKEIDRGLDCASINKILSQVYAASADYEEIIDRMGSERIGHVLEHAYKKTGKEYLTGWNPPEAYNVRFA